MWPCSRGYGLLLVSGWQSDPPFLTLEETGQWPLAKGRCPSSWGVCGGAGCGRLLGRGTELQQFQDDVPEAVNQMPVDQGLLQRLQDQTPAQPAFVLPKDFYDDIWQDTHQALQSLFLSCCLLLRGPHRPRTLGQSPAWPDGLLEEPEVCTQRCGHVR